MHFRFLQKSSSQYRVGGALSTSFGSAVTSSKQQIEYIVTTYIGLQKYINGTVDSVEMARPHKVDDDIK